MLCIRVCALLFKLTQATSQPHYLKVQRKGEIFRFIRISTYMSCNVHVQIMRKSSLDWDVFVFYFQDF